MHIPSSTPQSDVPWRKSPHWWVDIVYPRPSGSCERPGKADHRIRRRVSWCRWVCGYTAIVSFVYISIYISIYIFGLIIADAVCIQCVWLSLSQKFCQRISGLLRNIFKYWIITNPKLMLYVRAAFKPYWCAESTCQILQVFISMTFQTCFAFERHYANIGSQILCLICRPLTVTNSL